MVRTSTGWAPLSQARARNRSIWRRDTGRSSGTTTITVSMFAARACDSTRDPEDCRTSAVRRGRTARRAYVSVSPVIPAVLLAAHQSPTQTGDTPVVAMGIPPSAVSSWKRPRSTRPTRPSTVPVGASVSNAANASTTSSSAPRTRSIAVAPPSSCTEDIVVLLVDRAQHGRARTAMSGQFHLPSWNWN